MKWKIINKDYPEITLYKGTFFRTLIKRIEKHFDLDNFTKLKMVRDKKK